MTNINSPASALGTDAIKALLERARIYAPSHLLELAQRAEAELTALESALYTPSTWICDRCGFVDVRQVLYVQDGTVGAQRLEKGDRFVCPNDGSTMRRETWKERAASYTQAFDEQLEKTEALESALATATARVKELEQDARSFPSANRIELAAFAMHLALRESAFFRGAHFADTRGVLESALRAALAHLASTASLQQDDAPLSPYCPECDGVGWIEGGATLKNDCPSCRGTGWQKDSHAYRLAIMNPRPIKTEPSQQPLVSRFGDERYKSIVEQVRGIGDDAARHPTSPEE